MEQQPPLNWEASAVPTNPTVSSTLPPEVVLCLQNARFLHLATTSSSHPHISLMSYTYLPTTPFSPSPTIIMTTNSSSRKTAHLLSNPNVSLLVHDWSSTRDPAHQARASSPASTHGHGEDGGVVRRESSSLASMLLGLNTAALGRISVTITGVARVLGCDGLDEEEGRWCRAQHVVSHGFKDESAVEGEEGDSAGGGDGGGGGGGQGGFLEGEDVKVVVVRVVEGRIADWKGGVKDFVVRAEGEEIMVNGI